MNRFLSVLARPARATLRLPVKLMAAPRRMWGLSLPTRVALAVLLLVIIVDVVVWWKLSKAESRASEFAGHWLFWVVLILLSIAIPLAVRWAVRAWLEGPSSRFPEIDKAWNDGLKALREHHLDPTDIPIFVVHGLQNEAQANALFQASLERYTVFGTPEGLAELHWYASPNAIFLVCMCQSQVTALANAGITPHHTGAAQPKLRDTLRGTIQAMEMRDSLDGPLPTPATPAPGIESIPITETLRPGEDSVSNEPARETATGSASLRDINAPLLAAKLDHVCQLLRRLRQPACPINGILSIMPLELALDRHADQGQVQQALRSDLETLRRGLQLRCPAVMLVTGMEDEVGFRELVRRVGSDNAKNGRFGRGFNVWNAPSPEQVEAVTANACASFETWAYKLFREEDGLTKPGNPKLYSLICKVRTELRERLQNILVRGYGHGTGPGDALDDEPLLFGGCYFASVGERPDLQAFARGVLHRLVNDQDKLQWNREARREDAFYQRLAHVGFAIDGLLLLGIIAYLVHLWIGD